MIRFFVVAFALVSVSAVSQASSCSKKIQLTCRAQYLSQGKAVQTVTQSDAYADENWDEPSLANCASTLYFEGIQRTSIRVYSLIEGQKVTASGDATQIFGGRAGEKAFYGNGPGGKGVIGSSFSLGTIHLPYAMGAGAYSVSDVAITCIAR